MRYVDDFGLFKRLRCDCGWVDVRRGPNKSILKRLDAHVCTADARASASPLPTEEDGPGMSDNLQGGRDDG